LLPAQTHKNKLLHPTRPRQSENGEKAQKGGVKDVV
jgi:hypothetical protein